MNTKFNFENEPGQKIDISPGCEKWMSKFDEYEV